MDDLTKLIVALQPIVWPLVIAIFLIAVTVVVTTLLVRDKNVSLPGGLGIQQPQQASDHGTQLAPQNTEVPPVEPLTSAALIEVERVVIERFKNLPNQTERLVREVTILQFTKWAELVFVTIWNSQILLLQKMEDNGGKLPLQAAKKHYAQVRDTFAAPFSSVSFESYTQFLVDTTLIIRERTELVLGINGREFLNFVRLTKPANSRPY